MKFKIEKGVPMIPRGNDKGFTMLLRQLQVGDSFECPSSCRGSVYPAARVVKIKVAIRKTTGNLCRVWRVK